MMLGCTSWMLRTLPCFPLILKVSFTPSATLSAIANNSTTIFCMYNTVPMVDFLVKIQEVKAVEREDAVFECVLTHPSSKISWFGKNVPLEQGEKYDIEVSEDKLIHRLVVKDCMMVDKGIYSACAGIRSCNSWLLVEGKIVVHLKT